MNNTNRHEWEFEYTASVLAAAAQEQKTYRESRVAVWEGVKAEVMAKIKDSGISIHETNAEKLSNYGSTTGAIPTVMIDTTLQKDLSEAFNRIRVHREAVKDYDGWIQVLNANPEARLKLKHEDWLYFFGKK